MSTERDNWLKERRKGIGASEAAAACGISPWKSPYGLYLEKRGEVAPDPENEAMRWGIALEPIIRQRYADETGRSVRLVKTLQSEKYPFMFASPDGEVDSERGLEIKTARSDSGWGEPGTSEIPEHYLCQVQHQMIVVGYVVVDVPVLIGGSDFRIYEVPADRELQEMLIEREAEFWAMVENGTPPEPTTFSDIRQKYGKISRDMKIQATDVVISAVERLKELKAMAEEEETLKALIMGYLKDNDTLVDGKTVLATWKASNPQKRFDAKAFQAAHPDLYQQFLKEGEASRRFLIK